jgi:hypothetical protein
MAKKQKALAFLWDLRKGQKGIVDSSIFNFGKTNLLFPPELCGYFL